MRSTGLYNRVADSQKPYTGPKTGAKEDLTCSSADIQRTNKIHTSNLYPYNKKLILNLDVEQRSKQQRD